MRLRNKKTGEIREDSDLGKMLIRYAMPSYDSIAELCEDWEDYTPAEPLIKDEKIRKAVRAWAEVLGVERATYSDIDGEFYSGVNCIRLGQVNSPEPLKSDTYTITELCGEEEE